MCFVYYSSVIVCLFPFILYQCDYQSQAACWNMQLITRIECVRELLMMFILWLSANKYFFHYYVFMLVLCVCIALCDVLFFYCQLLLMSVIPDTDEYCFSSLL